ncbi:hypothetical protein [Streptomyces sp. RO-S4]|uniref:hypothetical protein n=1 Tax=Streptomyces sp. RO-S4 TaxID=2902486 RepID=UPI00208FCCCA|nr:hypothetical protein [Streptomyces sp. RO-S4]
MPLDEIDHPILAKAGKQFADSDTKHERIRDIDDQVLFKVKVQRWRGAVWIDADLPWLVAAGRREDGSGNDFYAALEAEGRAARARYNVAHADALRTETSTAHLLPAREDHVRYQAEAAVRFARRLRVTLLDLARASLRDGREHAVEFDTFTIGLQVRADDGHETYLAVRITGSVPPNVTRSSCGTCPVAMSRAGIRSTRCPSGSSCRRNRHGPTSWIRGRRRRFWTIRTTTEP